MSLSGHRALITGAGQGIGRACAEVFAARGADLVLLDRNRATLQEVVEKLLENGKRAVAVTVDLTDPADLWRGLETVPETGLVDILVNNAGFDRPGTTARISGTDLEAVLQIHLVAPLFLVQRFLPGMRAARWGRIINVGSIYGLTGAKGQLAYSTAKAGLIGFTKAVAKEAGEDGVTVNAVLPGLTRTPTIENFMAQKYKERILAGTPLNRMAEPEEIARVIAFLASDDASFITAAAIPVSGGWGI
ncbi:MAG: SDR family oxidoreductase [Deltaproteobacteria bacterium]|nr:SDR family oxidoreductase [Deltaproteobacteria bacterium]